MRMIRLAAVLATALFAVACGDPPAPTVVVEVSKSKSLIGAGRFVTVTVSGTINGNKFPENMSPSPKITTDVGSFEPMESASDEEIQSVDGVVSGGVITLKLYAPFRPGTATIKARVVDAYGTAVEGKAVVNFTAPQATVLNFSCRSNNIGVYADTATDFALACDATALDDMGMQVKNANIRFLAEAGVIRKSDDSEGDLPDYAYYPRQGERLTPKNVPPLEPHEPKIDVAGQLRNPRDQLVTLVAYIEGANPQTGDMFAGDPFIDMNDDKIRNEDEPFISADGSGTYSASQEILIWKQVKVVWSGAISQTPTIARCQVLGASSTTTTRDLTRDGSMSSKVTFQYTVLDDYYNVLAANTLSDQILWVLEPQGSVELDGQAPFISLKRNETGMDLDENGNFRMPLSAASFQRNAVYNAKVYNARPPEEIDKKAYKVYGSIQRNLTIDESGEPSRSVSDEALPVCNGQLF